MLKNFIKDQKGFTLVELLVVIAIIGLLSTIVIISFGAVRSSAADAAIKANLSQMRLMAEMQYNEKGKYDETEDRPDYKIAKGAILEAGGGGGVGGATFFNKFAGDKYCFSATLKDGSTAWCLDSTGFVGTKSCNVDDAECKD